MDVPDKEALELVLLDDDGRGTGSRTLKVARPCVPDNAYKEVLELVSQRRRKGQLLCVCQRLVIKNSCLFLRYRVSISKEILVVYIIQLTKTPLEKIKKYKQVLVRSSLSFSPQPAGRDALKPATFPTKQLQSFPMAPRVAYRRNQHAVKPLNEQADLDGQKPSLRWC
jgi:hypothetical protein